MNSLRSDYKQYISAELDNYSVKFIIDDYISQLISLSADRLNYFESKKLLLNIMSSDEFASFLSSEFHKYMDDAQEGKSERVLTSSPTAHGL